MTGVIEAENREQALAQLAAREIQVTNLEGLADPGKVDSGRIKADVLPPLKVAEPAAAKPRAAAPARLPQASVENPLTAAKAGPARIDYGLIFDTPPAKAASEKAPPKKLFAEDVTVTGATAEGLLIPPRYHRPLFIGLASTGAAYFGILLVASFFAKPAYNPKAPKPPPPPPYRIELVGTVRLPYGSKPDDVRAEIRLPDVDWNGGPSAGGFWSGPDKMDIHLKIPRLEGSPTKLTSYDIKVYTKNSRPVVYADQPLDDEGTQMVGRVPSIQLIPK